MSQARIQYCVVGGLAVNLHGVSRRTYNIDLVVRPETRTLVALQKLLSDLGLSTRQSIDLSELANESERRRLLAERNLVAITFFDPFDALRQVDVVVAPPLEPGQLVRRAVARRVEGVAVRVAALPDLILMKRVSGRCGDAGDVARLERLQAKSKRRR